MLNEMQLRVLSGLHRYPELFRSTPVYLCGEEPWLTVRKALCAYHAGKVDRLSMLRGMLGKYGWQHFEALMQVLEISSAVPNKRWAETQVRQARHIVTQCLGRRGVGHAA